MEEKTASAQGYNSMTFMVDKGTINLIIGSMMSFSMTMIILQHIGMRQCFPFVFITIIMLGLIYAFGGLGMMVGSNKEPDFTLKLPTAIASTIVSTFLFIFPIFFMQVVFLLMAYLLPAYGLTIKAFIPSTTNIGGGIECIMQTQ